jgi:hypothetical protein
MMKKAVAMLIPAAFFAAAVSGIVLAIEPMIVKENNNKFHAMLLGCTHIGKMEKLEEVLVFECAGKIELHKEVDWTLIRQ